MFSINFHVGNQGSHANTAAIRTVPTWGRSHERWISGRKAWAVGRAMLRATDP
jgi:hypothetical protein